MAKCSICGNELAISNEDAGRYTCIVCDKFSYCEWQELLVLKFCADYLEQKMKEYTEKDKKQETINILAASSASYDFEQRLASMYEKYDIERRVL